MGLPRHWGIFIPLIFCLKAAIAEEIQLIPNHPQSYTVNKGDTLWDIASKFLVKPEQWPQIWHSDDSAKNPRLIYPGDTLVLALENNQPSVRLTNRVERSNASAMPTTERLSPKIREMPLDEAILLIPNNKIANFLSYPRIVSAEELNSAPYVLDFANDHLIAGSGDKIYVRTINDASTPNYNIYRQGNAYTSPETGDVLGYEASFIANASLQKAGDPATLLVKKALREIRKGDRILGVEAREMTLNYFPKQPNKPIRGNIISVIDGVTQIGRYHSVVLDKGTEDGLAVGHVLNIRQQGRQIRDPFDKEQITPVSLPDESLGKLMVFRSFSRISYAIIMQATAPIHLLDQVVAP